MTEARHHLLPPNSTALERAASLALGPWTDGEAAIATLQNPATAPAALLPHVGMGEDLPLWPATEGEQRSLIAAAPRLHALIGTPKGLRELARLSGAHIQRLEMPPAKTFAGAWDAKSRAEWLAAHPEMRIYTQRQRTHAEGAHAGSTFTGGHMPRASAMARSAVRVEMRWPDGTVTPLSASGWTDLDIERSAVIDVARRSQAVGLHAGRALAGNTCQSSAASRIWRVRGIQYRERQSLLTIKQMAPSLTPLVPDAELVAERAPRQHVLCAGLPLAGFTSRSDSDRRLYARIRLHDPAVANAPKYGPSYLGFTRLSSPPFVALAHVRMPPHALPHAAAGSAMRAHLGVGTAASRMAPVLGAMDWARAEHDKVLIRTRLHGRARASRIYKAGAMLAGHTVNRS